MKQLNKTAYNFTVSLMIPFFMILNFLNKKESKVICKREFEIILLQIQSLSIKQRQFSFIKNTIYSDFKTFCEAFVIEFYLKSRLILRIITYLTYICWGINNFVIKSDIFRRFFICKNILKKLSCYHDNYFRYFMFGKYNGFVSKARVSVCMYFLVNSQVVFY